MKLTEQQIKIIQQTLSHGLDAFDEIVSITAEHDAQSDAVQVYVDAGSADDETKDMITFEIIENELYLEKKDPALVGIGTLTHFTSNNAHKNLGWLYQKAPQAA